MNTLLNQNNWSSPYQMGGASFTPYMNQSWPSQQQRLPVYSAQPIHGHDAAGTFGVQIAVNGVPRLDAINEATAAVGEYAAVSTKCLVTVAQTDCPCNCVSAPTAVTLVNPSEVGATDAHYNVIVSKLC